MTLSIAPRSPAPRRVCTMPMTTDMQRACAIRLIDRRTGTAHRINGSPLVIFSRRPFEAAAELLEGRDPQIWEARIDPTRTEVWT